MKFIDKYRNRSQKKLIINIIIIIVTFGSYIFLKPSGGGFNELKESEYSYNTQKVTKNNTWSKILNEKPNIFFIHTGETDPVIANYNFNQSGEFQMEFSLREKLNSNENGNINYEIRKNNSLVTSFDISQNMEKIRIGVNSTDTISIIADKNGSTSADWGNLELQFRHNNYYYELLVIPFLWSLLFLFFSQYNQIFIYLISYSVFILSLFSNRINFGDIPFRSILMEFYIFVLCSFIIVFISQNLKSGSRRIYSIVINSLIFICLSTLPIVLLLYFLNYGYALSKDAIFAVFQTNFSEAIEYSSDFVSPIWAILYVTFIILIIISFIKHSRIQKIKINNVILIFIITFLSTLILTNTKDFLAYNFISKGIEDYKAEIKLFKIIQDQRKKGIFHFTASKEGKGETYIVVIGESLNKNHMSEYGYFRNTTPFISNNLKPKGLLTFENAYSCHTHTEYVLSHSLTEANQFNKKKYYNSASIISLLQKADIETYWITNQILYGAYDNVVSVLASEAENLIPFNKSIGTEGTNITRHFDGDLVPKISEIINRETHKNKVVFVHLMGSHGDYCQRYPTEFGKYKGNLVKGEFGESSNNVSRSNFINCYDNSVLYNDKVINDIFSELEKLKESVSGLLYFSDHSEDVIKRLGHNISSFTYQMTEIPMFIWASSKYQNLYSETYKTLSKSTDKIFTNDLIFDVLIGFFQIKSDKYQAQFDLGSPSYKIDKKNAYTALGQRHLNSADNLSFWQNDNTQFLKKNNQENRVIPHRVNSVAKLHEVWELGFRAFECDVRFGDNNSSIFYLGHDKTELGLPLTSFLRSIDYNKLTKIWLDFKNLSPENYNEALEQLEKLDEEFNLKEKVILESGTTHEFFKLFSELGWSTSYYMPTELVLNLNKENDTKGLEKLGNTISQICSQNEISAISFDNRLYPFVKTYMEKKLAQHIEYHSWWGPKLNSNTFEKQLTNNLLYKDKRVKTILVTVSSEFDL